MKKDVNNLRSRNGVHLDFVGQNLLFTLFSRGDFGEQGVYINSLKELREMLGCRQFIERTKRAVAVERLKLFVSGIIPGDWGKVRSGWLARLLLNRLKRRRRRQNSPDPLTRSRASKANEGRGGEGR
jgi:hypothetical protein